MTHGMADYQDLYIEKFRTKEGVLQYARGPKWFAAEVRYEQIDIRGEDPEELQVVSTPHGPIVAGSPSSGSGLAFRHTGTQSGTPWMNTVYQLLHAKNADEIEAAVADWTEPVNNFVYADVHGGKPCARRSNGYLEIDRESHSQEGRGRAAVASSGLAPLGGGGSD